MCQKMLIENLNKIAFLNSIKLDLASEVVSSNELELYRSIQQNIDLTVKIGGCDATTDIFIAKSCFAKNILVPMVETPYSFLKIIENIKNVYEDINEVNLFINIETMTAYNNLISILDLEEAKYIKGLVLGRDDLTKSLGLNIKDVNSDVILGIAIKSARIAKDYNKEFVIGGKILPPALNFLKQVANVYLSKIETRRVVFGADIINKNFESAILSSILFEKTWLEMYGLKNKQNLNRIEHFKTVLEHYNFN